MLATPIRLLSPELGCRTQSRTRVVKDVQMRTARRCNADVIVAPALLHHHALRTVCELAGSSAAHRHC